MNILLFLHKVLTETTQVVFWIMEDPTGFRGILSVTGLLYEVSSVIIHVLLIIQSPGARGLLYSSIVFTNEVLFSYRFFPLALSLH
ncbi:hypothetical protein GDO78_019352 [Eleutherodactylus coqui]|uniref:Uncharacterized protein n=1 Tax=Eleutherodactylus coqui TaxID=57060 RepID=A0A8J6BJJ3_ELECQ|nr:hypothetical protein GDO78_019352 [Eleutherodactylus coqui]